MVDYAPDKQYTSLAPAGPASDVSWDPYSQYIMPSELESRLAQYLPVVGQSVSDPAWSSGDLWLSSASFLETPAMGTIKTLGSVNLLNTGAVELEYDATNTPPIMHDDGSVSFNTAQPIPTSSNNATASVFASAVRNLVGSTWTNRALMLGAGDTNRSVFTSATPNDVGYVDLTFTIPAVPATAAIFRVEVTPSAFASADGVMPYTVELVDKNGLHIGSAAQAANAGGTFNFTGITNVDLPGLAVRVKVTHDSTTTSATLNVDSVGLVVKYQTALGYRYRSELVFTSDKLDGSNDYTIMRFLNGDRIRVAFDVLCHNMADQGSGDNNSVFQSLGSEFGYSPVSIQVINKTWRVQHGQGVDIGFISPFQDGVWTRWELDILQGNPGTGTVKAWKDGVYLGTWTPPKGTFYTVTSWMYYKTGMYGAATAVPQGLPKVTIRNRRFSVTKASDGTTTTWRSPQVAPPGMHLFKRNPITGMPY